MIAGLHTVNQPKYEGADRSLSLPIGMDSGHRQTIHHNLGSSFPYIHQQDARHHLPYSRWGMTSSDPTTCVARNIVLLPPLVTHMYRAANLWNTLTIVSQLNLNSMRTVANSIQSLVSDINAKYVHNWHQNCQHSQVSSQAIQAYQLSRTKGVYMQRGLAVGKSKPEISSGLLKACDNVSYALI